MKPLIRKLMHLILTAVLVMALAVPSFADSSEGAASNPPALSESKAVSIALSNAGLTKTQVRRLEAEYDSKDGTYEIEFIKKSNKAEYEYEISASDGRIFEKSIDYACKKTKSKKKIGKKAACRKVAKFSGVSYSTVSKGTCTYKYKGHKGKYVIKFRSGNYKYECEVLAPNGKILEYEWEMIKR